MSVDIKSSIDTTIEYLTQHPEKTRYTAEPVTAVLEEGLRCRIEGPNGATLASDMPSGVGGGGTAPTPSWLSRAALATCEATVIALRAAREGVSLTELEVAVEGEFDNRGVLGMDDSVPAGPLSLRTRVRIGADGVDPEILRQIVEWATSHSPVGDVFHRTVPTEVELEIA
jgi:uncharacterized OsmC-like protein